VRTTRLFGGFLLPRSTKEDGMSYVIVFLGAGIGGALRHGANLAAARLLGLAFPFGTLGINIVGSFAMAIIVEYFALRSGLSQSSRLFLTTGLLGGFTTFSAFSLDAVNLFERGQVWPAAAYVVFTVAGSIGALMLGLALLRSVLGSSA
jgi:CrcB protein